MRPPVVLFDDPLLAALPAEHPLVEERNIDPQHLVFTDLVSPSA